MCGCESTGGCECVWVSAYMRERERNVCVKHSSCNLALFNVL